MSFLNSSTTTKETETVSINTSFVETVIGSQTKFKGSVTTDKPIKVDGVFEGEIHSTDVVYVSETGYINGTVECRECQLTGKAEGKITCTELMQIAEIGYFKGELVTEDLIVVKGSKIDGTCKVGQKENVNE